jgi:hypothetical protein
MYESSAKKAIPRAKKNVLKLLQPTYVQAVLIEKELVPLVLHIIFQILLNLFETAKKEHFCSPRAHQ